MKFQSGISVVVCAHNSADLIQRTLECLKNQEFDGAYELIFVDNNSTDRTFEIVTKWIESNDPLNFEFSAFKESNPGKTYAQDLGFSKAKFKYLLVCDDDNFLSPNYLQTAFDYLENHPNAGILGGQGRGVSDVDLPDWFDSFYRSYATGPQGKATGDITNEQYFVYGAGSVIRNQPWQEMVAGGVKRVLNSVQGKIRTCGEDHEMGFLMVAGGYQIHFHHELEFDHFIKKEKLSLFYLKQLKRGYATSYETFMVYKELVDCRIRKKWTIIKDLIVCVIRVVWLTLKGPIYGMNNKNRIMALTFYSVRAKHIISILPHYEVFSKKMEQNILKARCSTQYSHS